MRLGPVCAALLALAVAGCGGGGDEPRDSAREDRPPRAQPAPAPDAAPGAPTPRGAPDQPRLPGLPEGVPTSADGPAPAGSEPVIRAWLSAVRRADFEAAADTFADGARVQNGGPVMRLDSRARAILWNAALPCGATLTEVGGAKGYAVVEFRLTDRRGSSCGSGKGAPAYGAIRVEDGKITEWYRLPDPVAPSGAPAAPFI
jgi:limonene-1,2-epoxide hydrolase